MRESTRHIGEYNYVVINDDFSAALNDLKSLSSPAADNNPANCKNSTKLLKQLTTAKVDEL